jgi:hypothetical protein
MPRFGGGWDGGLNNNKGETWQYPEVIGEGDSSLTLGMTGC